MGTNGSLSFLTIIAEKGYIGDRLASDLRSKKRVNFISVRRGNRKSPLPKFLRQMIFRATRRVEYSEGVGKAHVGTYKQDNRKGISS